MPSKVVNCGGSGVSEGEAFGLGEPDGDERRPRRGPPVGLGIGLGVGAGVRTGAGACASDAFCASPALAVAIPRMTARPMTRRRRLKFTWYASPELLRMFAALAALHLAGGQQLVALTNRRKLCHPDRTPLPPMI
jgi:hypothetical protein